MKAAFACRDRRIAPVFDIARRLHLVEVESGRIVKEAQEILPDDLPVQKALRLAELGVGTLICGAISRPLHGMVSAHGIQVIPFVAGELHEIIKAWLDGGLQGDAFAMPGCRGRSPHRIRGTSSTQKEGWDMPGNTSGGRGAGGGGRGQR
jgi:predicted Fe-Mo cluster-binding NifX family protein